MEDNDVKKITLAKLYRDKYQSAVEAVSTAIEGGTVIDHLVIVARVAKTMLDNVNPHGAIHYAAVPTLTATSSHKMQIAEALAERLGFEQCQRLSSEKAKRTGRAWYNPEYAEVKQGEEEAK